MQPHFSNPTDDPTPSPFTFPTLPIVTPDAAPPLPRRTEREKYGGLFTLGALGLVVVVLLVGWFGWGVWSHRAVWSNIYILHDEHRPEGDRIRAAFALARDPRVNQRQLWEMALRKPLPPLARYVLAEALTAEAAQADPRAYALAVARSEGWPDWLRLLLLRPMAYAAVEGTRFPVEPLEELGRRHDPTFNLWAAGVLASQQPGPAGDALQTLKSATQQPGPLQELAALLFEASNPMEPRDLRFQSLERATHWLRLHHPEAAGPWEGWEVQGDHLVRRP